MTRLNNLIASVLLAFVFLSSISLPVASQQSASQQTVKVAPYKREPSATAVKWANEELARMSIEEKIGQLISVGINATFLNQDSDAFRALKHQIEDDKVGGIILFRGPVYESVILVNRMQQLARYPLLISADLRSEERRVGKESM